MNQKNGNIDFKNDLNCRFIYCWRRYQHLENEFIAIAEIIPLTKDWEAPNYKFGSYPVGDCLIRICGEIETLLKIYCHSPKFEGEGDAEKAKRGENIGDMKPFCKNVIGLPYRSVYFRDLEDRVNPFLEFNDGKLPEWFKIYSRDKHNKLKLVENVNMKHLLYSLAGLYLLLCLHPDDFPGLAFDHPSEIFGDKRQIGTEEVWQRFEAGNPW